MLGKKIKSIGFFQVLYGVTVKVRTFKRRDNVLRLGKGIEKK